jgi:hypothetical protein
MNLSRKNPPENGGSSGSKTASVAGTWNLLGNSTNQAPAAARDRLAFRPELQTHGEIDTTRSRLTLSTPMKTTTCLCILVFLLLPTVPAAGQASSSTGFLHAEIQKLYDFHPHTLSTAQINQKSDLLDQFWTKAKSQRDVYVPELRRELADFSNPPFFLFDGSQLLLSLSDAPADRKIVLSAIVHTGLRDLQLKDYFLLVQRMAAQGEDTTAAAFHILPEPKFQVFIPQHSLTLAQDYCMVYMLLPTNQSFWVQPAIDRLRAETDVTAQKSLLLLLWYAQTPDSDKAIQEFSTTAKSQDSKDYANELVHRKDAIARTAAVGSSESEESLRQARRERMKAVSDEALYDLDSYTAKIMAIRK